MNIVNAIRRFLGVLQHWMAWPLRWMTRERATRMVDQKVSIFRRLSLPVIWCFAYFLYAISNAGDLIVGWSRSRPIRALMFGAPALLTVIAFTAVIGFNYATQQDVLVKRYSESATKAESNERYDTARIYYLRLMELSPTDKRNDLALALTYDKEGNDTEAEIRMKKLLVYPEIAAKVNFWMAQKTLKREDVDDHTKWIVARGHIRKFLERSPQDYQGNELAKKINFDLANYYTQNKQFEDAIDALKETESNLKVLAGYDRRLELELAKTQAQLSALHMQINATTQAESYAKTSRDTANRSIGHYRGKVAEKFDSIEDLLRLSEGLLFTKEYEQAIRPLDVAMQNDRTKKLAPKLIPFKSKVLAVWAKEVLDTTPNRLAESFELVEKSLELDPNNESAILVLAQISIKNRGPVSQDADQKLKSKLDFDGALEKAAAPFVVHLLLGSDAANHGNNDVAIRHLRQALVQNPQAPVVLNNLAFVLARIPEPQFNDALTLINNALKITPGHPRFLDTRGGIYLLMKQYELAFHDLELAELNIKDSDRLYKDLVMLARELGFEKHQKKYTQRLEKLQAAQKLSSTSTGD